MSSCVREFWVPDLLEVAIGGVGHGDRVFIDEVFVKINGKQHYVWRAVDQDGKVVDAFLLAVAKESRQ